LSRWASADRVEIRSNLAVRVGLVDNPEQVTRLIKRTVALGNEGWTVPARGVPVAKIRLEFYEGEKLLGSLGVGNSFLALQHSGEFLSRRSDPSVRAELLALAGVDDPEQSE
jgi:hypothetical protein